MNNQMSGKQQFVLMATCIFSPMVRLLPRLNTAKAGSGAWISVIIAIVPALLLVVFSHYIIQGKDQNRTLGEMFNDAYGKVAGSVVNIFVSLWLVFYGGVVLRTSSERMISTIYKQADPMYFAIVLLLLIVMVAIGKNKTLAYVSQVTWYVLVPVVALVTLFALANVKVENLFPVDLSKGVDYLKGSVPVISVMSPWVYFLYFPICGNRKEYLASKISRLCMAFGIAFAVTVTTIGVLGAELTEVLHDPFFSMIRTLNVFGVLERMESLVISLWVLTDVIYLGGLLAIALDNFRKILGAESLRWTAVMLGAGMLGSSVLVAGSVSQLSYASEVLLPAITLCITYGFIPVSGLVSLRKRRSAGEVV